VKISPLAQTLNLLLNPIDAHQWWRPDSL
jgi:hypothetical protein